MDAMDCIFNRRSIRKFKPERLSYDVLERIVSAGMYAPSARNEQPWQFVIIDKREILDAIPEVHPHAAMLRDAPAAICVAADTRLDKCPGANYWIQDCAAATQNILLASYAEGLGACWLGTYPRQERMAGIRKLLEMPEAVIPFSVIALGYPAEAPGRPDRFLKGRVHCNSF